MTEDYVPEGPGRMAMASRDLGAASALAASNCELKHQEGQEAMAKYEVIEWMGAWAIRHAASGTVVETFTRKCSAMKRLNHSYS